MIVLGIDCTTKSTNVGVAKDGIIIGEQNMELGRKQAAEYEWQEARIMLAHSVVAQYAAWQTLAEQQRIVQKRLSVREAERLAQLALKPVRPVEEKKTDRDVMRLQEELSDFLGAKVEIRTNKKGAGRIQIDFGDLDQLEGILQRLR